jgi:uncharacterized DUF497 family protein
MDIAFDPAKDAANRRRHGVSLALGRVVLENLVGEDIDEDERGAEERWRAYGFVGTRLYVCVYTMRGDVHRIVSVRKATTVEEREWLR